MLVFFDRPWMAIDESAAKVVTVFVVGAPRSGTTIVGRYLAAGEGSVRLDEPSRLWSGGGSGPFDVMSVGDVVSQEHDATRRAILTLLGSKRVLVDKSPANSLRIPYLDAIVPEAKFVHVHRHPVDAISSAALFWSGRSELVTRERLLERARFRWSEGGVASVARDFRRIEAFCRGMVGVQPRSWGPRVPGLQEIRREFGPPGAAAYQWMWCAGSALVNGRALGSERYREVELASLSVRAVGGLAEWCGIDGQAPMDAFIEHFVEERVSSPRASAIEPLPLRELLQPIANALGHELD